MKLMNTILLVLVALIATNVFGDDYPTNPESYNCNACSDLYFEMGASRSYALGAPYWSEKTYDSGPTTSSSITLGDCGPEPGASGSFIPVLTANSEEKTQTVVFGINTVFSASGWTITGFWNNKAERTQVLTLTDGVKPWFNAPTCAKRKYWLEYLMWERKRVADVSMSKSAGCYYWAGGQWVFSHNGNCTNGGPIDLGFRHTGADYTPKSEALECPECPLPGC